MISKEVIEEVKNRLVRAYDHTEIYLFGSYAWGTPNEDSDLDLLIVVEKSSQKTYERPFAACDTLFGMGISKDIIVYTKDEFEKYSSNRISLCHKIKQDGKLIYAKS